MEGQLKRREEGVAGRGDGVSVDEVEDSGKSHSLCITYAVAQGVLKKSFLVIECYHFLYKLSFLPFGVAILKI